MLIKVVILIILMTNPVWAQGKMFTLHVPIELAETGFMKHLLPRFSLKTGVRITISPEAGEATFGSDGKPVFRQNDKIWHLSRTNDTDTEVFEAWLLSDVGKRTIEAYAPNGNVLFNSDVAQVDEIEVVALTGDLGLGEAVSFEKCGRCHAINETNRMDTIGSSPSFALMRTFPDWQSRFESFFVLRPHPSFTQGKDITEPFPDNLPPPIIPIELTVHEIEAITAYVGSIEPADLGAPIQTQ